MNVKDNHKAMNLFVINDYEKFFIYGHGKLVRMTQFLKVPFNRD